MHHTGYDLSASLASRQKNERSHVVNNAQVSLKVESWYCTVGYLRVVTRTVSISEVAGDLTRVNGVATLCVVIRANGRKVLMWAY